MNIELSNTFTSHIISSINNELPRLPNALFDLLVGILIIRVAGRLVRLVMKITNVQPGIRGVVSSILESLMWLLLTVALLGELGFNGIIYFFTGSIAAIGIAMAAGGSTLVADIVAGIFLARDNDFNVGDEVIVGETPTLGTIESMDARRTRLRDDNGVLHVIPNSVVERKEWVVIRKRRGVGTLVKATKAAKRLGVAALEKRAAVVRKKRSRS
ncbi:MAG TPA: mechanosensitive ion channel domain-containing protein [Candidatus Saccharimonadia bacterium]|nr:mechanosensitive ion channel domain-containing protein [Candidatus Saccharimonadia bacterium]